VRLVLNDEGLWPLRGDPPPLDPLLTDASAADDWRRVWHQGMTKLGAAEATERATPLADSVFGDYPGKDG